MKNDKTILHVGKISTNRSRQRPNSIKTIIKTKSYATEGLHYKAAVIQCKPNSPKNGYRII